MRLLHALQAEESHLRSGTYICLDSGEPNGYAESWQITRLADGSEVVRAEVLFPLEGHPTALLTHLQRDSDDRPKWLRMRYERDGAVAAAQYTFDKAEVQIVRQAQRMLRQQEKLDIADDYVVDYHPVIANEYVWRGYPDDLKRRKRAIPVISPDLWVDGNTILEGRSMRFNVQPMKDTECDVPAGSFKNVRQFEVIFPDGVNMILWYDEIGTPLRCLYPEKQIEFLLETYTQTDM